MLYHILKLNNIPEPVFAHVYSCPDYAINFKEMMPNLEIAYIKTGELSGEFMGEPFTAKENSILLLPHRYRFVIKSVSPGAHIHYTASALVDPEEKIVTEIPKTLSSDELCLPFCLPNCADTPRLAESLCAIIGEYQKGTPLSKKKCGAMFAALLCDIANAAQNTTVLSTGKAAEILDQRIKLYIAKNLSQKISLSDIAEAVGKNGNYLNQVFSKKNHMSIISYVNLAKMKHVASLLTSHKLTLKEAAKEVGITDTSYLSRLFKEKMGMTISEFKSNSVDYTFSLNDMDKIF